MKKSLVLMATYNGAEFITEQLDSLKNQTQKVDYVLIRDDSSTDNTVVLVEDYISKNNLVDWEIRVNEKNIGWRENFRKLMHESENFDVDFIFFCDQDDYWLPEKNEKQIVAMEANPAMKVISGDFKIKIIGEKPKKIAHQEQLEDVYEPEKRVAKVDFHSYGTYCYRLGWTYCIRKTFMSFVLNYYKNTFYPIAQDTLFGDIAAEFGGLYNLNEVIGITKRHEGNASGGGVTLSAKREKHLIDLEQTLTFYEILYAMQRDKNMEEASQTEKMREFYFRRVENAKSRNFVKTIAQVAERWNLYRSNSNRVRDLIFLFKK